MDNAQLVLSFHSFVLSVSLCKPVLEVSRIQEENYLKVGGENLDYCSSSDLLEGKIEWLAKTVTVWVLLKYYSSGFLTSI